MKTPPSQKRNSEVQAARGRLQGALKDSLPNQEVDDIPEDYDEEEDQQEMEQRRPQRGRPKKIQQQAAGLSRVDSLSPIAFLTPNKRRKRDLELSSAGHKIQAESFVMKLFDRSLDLSKYTEQTSLYPICRAWMANQPRNPSIRSYRDARSPSPTERIDNGKEILLQLRKGSLREVASMPKLKKADIPKIPPPQDEPRKYDNTEELIDPDDNLKDGSKEDLLAEHINKWKQIKSDWQKHTKVYEHRNEVNFNILQELFRP